MKEEKRSNGSLRFSLQSTESEEDLELKGIEREGRGGGGGGGGVMERGGQRSGEANVFLSSVCVKRL